jgi:hypothetical protein
VTNRAMARAARVMETTMRVAVDKLGDGDKGGGRADGNRNKEGNGNEDKIGGAGGGNNQPLHAT